MDTNLFHRIKTAPLAEKPRWLKGMFCRLAQGKTCPLERLRPARAPPGRERSRGDAQPRDCQTRRGIERWRLGALICYKIAGLRYAILVVCSILYFCLLKVVENILNVLFSVTFFKCKTTFCAIWCSNFVFFVQFLIFH